jgi:transcription elongation factor GreA
MAAVAMQMLSRLATLVRARNVSEETRKEQIATLRNALFMRDGAILGKALEEARGAQITALKNLSENHPALTAGMRARMHRALERVEPSLFEKVVPPWEQDVIFTTVAGMDRRKQDLEELVHERLPQIMREIGEAASFGDISDNAEFQSAVQERGRLAEMAARMQEEIAEAQIITPEIASAEHVTVGSRVVVRNLETGQEEAFVFLGPWDAKPEQGVYAYNAPLGLSFMGQRVGDEVTFQAGFEERRWQITEIGPGL